MFILIPCTKINSQYIKDLRIRHEILKVIEEKLFSIGLGNNILDMKPKAQATKAKLKAPVQSRKHLRVKKAV